VRRGEQPPGGLRAELRKAVSGEQLDKCSFRIQAAIIAQAASMLAAIMLVVLLGAMQLERRCRGRPARPCATGAPRLSPTPKTADSHATAVRPSPLPSPAPYSLLVGPGHCRPPPGPGQCQPCTSARAGNATSEAPSPTAASPPTQNCPSAPPPPIRRGAASEASGAAQFQVASIPPLAGSWPCPPPAAGPGEGASEWSSLAFLCNRGIWQPAISPGKISRRAPRFSLLLAIFLFFLFARAGAQNTAFETGCHSWLLFKTSVTHASAKASCVSLDYTLATVESDEGWNALRAAITDLGGYWWMGLERGSSWIWQDGRTTSYSRWNSGEPNDSGGNEDCVSQNSAGTWNDINCASSFYYVCNRLPLATCGDGVLGGTEECDDGDGNADGGATGSYKADCTLQVCGDGDVAPDEVCDDGNTVDGDGCSADCGGCESNFFMPINCESCPDGSSPSAWNVVDVFGGKCFTLPITAIRKPLHDLVSIF